MNRTFIMRECLGKALWLCFCLSIAGCTEDDRMTPLSADSGDTADELIPIHISLTGDNDYHSSSFNDASTRSHSPLIAEWVGVKAFSPTRTGEQPDYDGPRIASMELTEDTLPRVSTRATVPVGVYFRLIVFRKSGSEYVFQSAADYTSNGTGTPVLKQGKLLTRSGTIRVVGYSFNTTADLGDMPPTYAYNSSTVSIPDMSKDFMTFDSGDITNVNSLSHNLPVSFSQKLCKLTISISVTGFTSNTISGCTGVYVKQGGNSTSWVIGSSAVAANTSNTASFNPNTNQTTTIRMVPFASARTITVHFNKLTVGNLIANNADNIDIASTQSVQLKEGMSYTMKIQFKRSPGINVPAGSINLSNPQKACTNDDKQKLSKLVFADGNLKSTGASNNYVWATNKEYGYYYQWKKDYNGNNIDPCARLNPTTYGSGWRLPTRNEMERLGRCTNVKKVSNGVNGVWFLNATTGIFLPLGGWRNKTSGTTADEWPGTYGDYFADESINTTDCYRLDLPGMTITPTQKMMAYTTRCVKGPKL